MVNTRHKLLTVISFTFFGSLYAPESQEQFCLEDIPEEIIVKELVEEKDLLLEAMIQVESRGIEDQIGDRHLGRPSVGVLQIRPIMVREINRILKKQNIKKKLQMNDRYSRSKSIEMFYIWKDYHHPEDSDEVIARCWNGGPKGWKRKSTDHYWNKVKIEMETRGNSM